MFKCFKQCFIKANFQIISSLLKVSCAPWYQTKISLQIISKKFPLSFKNIHLIKQQKLTKDIGCFVSLNSSKPIIFFDSQTYFPLQDYSEKNAKTFLIYVVRLNHRPIFPCKIILTKVINLFWFMWSGSTTELLKVRSKFGFL